MAVGDVNGDDLLDLVVADLDGDGWLDLVTANTVSHDVSVLLNAAVRAARLRG